LQIRASKRGHLARSRRYSKGSGLHPRGCSGLRFCGVGSEACRGAVRLHVRARLARPGSPPFLRKYGCLLELALIKYGRAHQLFVTALVPSRTERMEARRRGNIGRVRRSDELAFCERADADSVRHSPILTAAVREAQRTVAVDQAETYPSSIYDLLAIARIDQQGPTRNACHSCGSSKDIA
jgi:hypothetical protein